MSLSQELQTGKAGEHLVCFDLITQGYNAFLSDQGLPFDVLVENNGVLKRIQVKSVSSLREYDKSGRVYRFSTRRGRKGTRTVKLGEVDYYAFVALDIKCIAYIPISDMANRNDTVKQCIDFKSRRLTYTGRVYSNGTRRTPEWGKYLEDYGVFTW